jgi:hypothetical protein
VSREDDDSYQEIPFQFHGLEKSFANIADHAVSRVREWFVSGDPMFNFRASRLLASSGRTEFDRMCRDVGPAPGFHPQGQGCVFAHPDHAGGGLLPLFTPDGTNSRFLG